MKKKILGMFVCMLLIATAVPAVESLKNSTKNTMAPKTSNQLCSLVNWTEKQKLLASDAAQGDNFSYSLSLSGDTALIGAYQNDDNGTDSGAAYVFTRTGTTWTQQAKLLASDGSAYDRFGFGVSIDENTALIGAPSDNYNRGSVYVFTRSGDTWTQQQKLVAADAAAQDMFGMFLSIDDDSALISATGDDSIRGSAYVFTRNGTTWIQEAKLLASDGAAQDYFGQTVSIDGDTAIIGASYDDDSGTNSGSVYVFARSGTTWTQEAKLLAFDGEANDNFGISVSLEGDTALIAAPADDDSGYNSGSAYIFTRTDDAWTEQQKLNASDGAAGDLFGWWSVSLSGATALIGAMRNDDYGTSSGSAYVFTRTGTTWSEEAKLLASDGAAEDYFGYAVSLDGDTALIGAYLDDDNGVNSGSAYVFTRINGNPPIADFSWTPQNPSPNQQITFDASASHDPDGSITIYEWDWNNDSIYDEGDSSPTTTHSWTNAGSYPVTVRVTDNDNTTGTLTKTVGLGINIEIDIKGGLEVKAVITNNGASDVTGVTWQIQVKGGILRRINKTMDGVINIPAAGSKTVGTGMLFGFGTISITAKVADEEQTATGTQIIIYSMVK